MALDAQGKKVPHASLALKVSTDSGEEVMCLQQLSPNMHLRAGDVERLDRSSYKMIDSSKIGVKVARKMTPPSSFW